MISIDPLKLKPKQATAKERAAAVKAAQARQEGMGGESDGSDYDFNEGFSGFTPYPQEYLAHQNMPYPRTL